MLFWKQKMKNWLINSFSIVFIIISAILERKEREIEPQFRLHTHFKKLYKKQNNKLNNIIIDIKTSIISFISIISSLLFYGIFFQTGRV